MTEPLLSKEVARQVKSALEQVRQPVQVLFFGKADGCDYCDETWQLLQEVTALSSNLSLSQYDLETDAAVAAQYRVDKAPGIVLAGREGERIVDYGIRLSGIPSGHEFSTLIHDMILVGGRDSGLSQKTRQFLSKLEKPVHLQVFVTPT